MEDQRLADFWRFGSGRGWVEKRPATLPVAGVYSVEITEVGTSLGTPSYILTSTTPDYREDLISLKLYDQANTLLATGVGTTTRALTANLTPGVYKLSMAKFKSPLVATKSPHPSELFSVFRRPKLSSLRARFFHAEGLAFSGDHDGVME